MKILLLLLLVVACEKREYKPSLESRVAELEQLIKEDKPYIDVFKDKVGNDKCMSYKKENENLVKVRPYLYYSKLFGITIPFVECTFGKGIYSRTEQWML